MPAAPWGLTDGIIIINLDRRVDRWAKLRLELPDRFPDAEIVRLSAVDGVELEGYGQQPYFRGGKRNKAWAGKAGCTLSHRNAIAYAKAKNWSSVLILEDDVVFPPDFSSHVNSLTNILRRYHGRWQVFYLGFLTPIGPVRMLDRISEHHELYQVYGAAATHAYIVRHDAYDWLLRELPTASSIWKWIAQFRVIDRWYSRNLSRHFGVFAASPSLIGQYSDFSDIGQRVAPHTKEQFVVNELAKLSSRNGAMSYSASVRLRTIHLRIIGLYDWLRSLLKRINGL